MEIILDSAHHPRMEFQFNGTSYTLTGIDAHFYRVDINGVGVLIDLDNRWVASHNENVKIDIDENSLIESVASVVTDEFDKLAYIGLLKRNIEDAKKNIENINRDITNKQQDLILQEERLKKLLAHLHAKENPNTQLNTLKNSSRWKTSVPLASIWSLIDCVDDMREYTPKLIDLIQASGDTFDGTDFVKRLESAARDGDLMAFENAVESITDYADANNIWINE